MSRAAIILDSDFQRKKAVDWVWALKDGTRVEFKGPKRTLDQNSLFWVLLTEVAVQLKWHGQKLTPDDWKLQFLDALRRSKREELHIVPNIDNTGFVNLSSSSSDLSKEEMSELIELILAFGAANGVTFHNSNQPAADNDAGTAEPVASPSGSATETSGGAPDESSGASPSSQDAGTAVTNSPETANENGPETGAATSIVSEAIVQGGIPVGANASHSGVTSPGGENPAPESSGEEEKVAGASDGAVLVPAAELSEEDRAWLKLGAHWMLAALPADDPEALRVLLVQVAEIRKVMPKDVSRDALQRMEHMRIHCRQVCDGKEKLSKTFMAAQAMTTPAEIEPKAIKTTRAAT